MKWGAWVWAWKGRLVVVDFIEPDAVLVAGVLDDVEASAPGLIVHRADGIWDNGVHELLLAARLDLNGRDDHIHLSYSFDMFRIKW